MKFNEFKLERYFAKYEFTTQYLLSTSDCEGMSLTELLGMSDNFGLELWHNLHLGYTQSQGHPLLLEEISRLYPGTSADDILVTVPEEGIFIALSTILNAGDHVVIIDPAYQSLYEIPNAMNCSITKWPITIKDNQWTLDVELLKHQIRDNTKLIIINFPHNPTGYLPLRNDFSKIIDIARKNGIYIFSDEMYWLSEYDLDERLEPMGICYEKGITLSGLSKTFGLPGLRMGWLVTKDKNLAQQFRAKKDYTTICSSAPSEILAIIALRTKNLILARNQAIIKNNLLMAQNFFLKHNRHFNWLAPRAGSVALTELTKDICVEQFCENIIKEKNLLILPGKVFDFSGNFFRFGLGKRDLYLALEKLDEYILEFL